MVRKGYTPEQIINKLREAEVLINQGATAGEASRKIGVTEQVVYTVEHYAFGFDYTPSAIF